MANPRLFLGIVLSVAILPAWCDASCEAASEAAVAQTVDLEREFRDPRPAARPWAYWWWLKGNVDESLITRDLEGMTEKGFAGLLLFDARGYNEDHVPLPESRMEFMSPEWREMVKFAMSEANRLGLQMSINLSSCAGALKGPWDVGDDAPKKLLWTAGEVQGPARLSVELKRPDMPHFQDVALVAVRHRKSAETVAASAPEKFGGFPESWQEIQPQPRSAGTTDGFVDLTRKVDAQGRLAWDVPEGRWTLVRFGRVTIEGHEYDVDILDPKAVEGHFQRMAGTLLRDAGPLAGKTLTHFYSVSWEGAIPTWTSGFERHFQSFRGYDMRPYLPVLAGLTVENRETSERFLRDYYKTLGDCFMNNCYGKLRDLCHQRGLQWHSESGGPWDRKLPTLRDADQLAFLARNDMPQGEFWHLGRAMNRPPAMAAHIYGKRLAATEAFTHMLPHWSAYPAALKGDADAAFCDGVNHFIWHTFTASPPEFGKPGSEYFAGTHINPNVTWWDDAGPLVDYLGRCQATLRQGHFVADVCSYVGDRPYQHWGRGEKWSEKPSLVLGKGYAYDLVNTEVLLERMSVADGDLAMPDGMRYRVLVVDLEDDAAPPEALAKIVELAKAGATVVLGSRRPVRAPGLRDYPACDQQVARLASELWGAATDGALRRSLGRGRLIVGTDLDEALKAENIPPDYAGSWNYTHRRVDGTDIYFLSGTGDAECVFRTQGREPELWDPATGAIRDTVSWHATDDGRTSVSLRLPEGGSTFVVFRKPALPCHVVSITAPDAAGELEIEGRSARGVRLRLWGAGRYVLKTSENEAVTIDADPLPDPLTLTGPWQVRFAPGWGAPESAVFDKLVPWNEHPHEGIKHFAGTATYETTFELDESQTKGLVRIALGEVKHVARVRVNGVSLGTVWTAPWAVDATEAVKPGKNVLKIDVTNLWVNRLIGDAGLPKEKRLTKTNVRLQSEVGPQPTYRGYPPTAPLDRSGLLGPVRVEFGQEMEKEF